MTERARTARRMGRTLQDMATENATDDAAIVDTVQRGVLWPVVVAGGTAITVWWKGGELTLGQTLTIVGGAGIVVVALWWRFARRSQ